MTLHPQAKALLAEILAADGSVTDDLVGHRAAARAAAVAVTGRIGLDHVVDLDADGVRVRLYRPRPGAPVALYVHGGGRAMHDLQTHDVFCPSRLLLAGCGPTLGNTASMSTSCRGSATRRGPTSSRASRCAHRDCSTPRS